MHQEGEVSWPESPKRASCLPFWCRITFTHTFWGSNSCLHACKACDLLTELSPVPLNLSILTATWLSCAMVTRGCYAGDLAWPLWFLECPLNFPLGAATITFPVCCNDAKYFSTKRPVIFTTVDWICGSLSLTSRSPQQVQGCSEHAIQQFWTNQPS